MLNQVFIGTTLCCRNTADEVIKRVIPDNLAEYIHDYRVGLKKPFFIQAWRPEISSPGWVKMNSQGNFEPVLNKWTRIISSEHRNDRWLRHELNNQPHILGVHCPSQDIDVLNTSNSYIRQKSLATITEIMKFANDVSADYFVYPLFQKSYCVDVATRRNELVKESHKIFSWIIEEYLNKRYNFIIGLENLLFPKYPATPYEIKQALSSCRQCIPKELQNRIKLIFNLSHLWRSRSIIIETQKHEFENIKNKSFQQILWDSFDMLGQDDIYIFYLSGCYGYYIHEIPGITTDEEPFDSIYRFDCNDSLFDESYEMNYSKALDAIVNFCFINSQPIRIILDVHNRSFPVVMNVIMEINNAIYNKINRRCKQ